MKIFTIGYIDHDKTIYDTFLGPSLHRLEGDFDLIKTTDEKFPAENYNKMKDQCKTKYLILTHHDVSFGPFLLRDIEFSLNNAKNVGAIGMVGKTKENVQTWRTLDTIHELDTLDCCFICFNKDEKARFDEKNFNDYHLYVEDFCAQLNRTYNKKIYTIQTSELYHHSATLKKRGGQWGRYKEFKQKLLKKWPGIKTT